jgi:hypothetical protein
MRHLENALVWLVLAVGVPVMFYAMAVIPDHEEPEPFASRYDVGAYSGDHDTRGAKVVQLHVNDDDPISSPDGEQISSPDDVLTP